MPTKVQSPTPEHPYDKVHDPHLYNKNGVHRDALRLALGSILTPKRPHHSPSSRSTSGSLSPAYSASHTPGTGTPVHPHHPPPFGSEYLHPHHVYHYHSHHTPSKLAQTSSTESSPRGSAYSSPTLPMQPMMLSSMPEPEDILRHPPARDDTYDLPPSPGLGPIDDSDPRLRPLRPTLAPLQPAPNGAKSASLPTGVPRVGHGPDLEAKRKEHATAAAAAAAAAAGRGTASGQGTPKAKFFEALQGKSAWDALIHGSFS